MTRIHAQHKPAVFSSNNTTSTSSTSSSNMSTSSSSSPSQKIQVKLPITSSVPSSTHSTLVTPLTVSKSNNEFETTGSVKKNAVSSTLDNSNSSIIPKKRTGDKKLDKKQADKKRSLKRL
ncbi:hypothetical protein Glove_575g41 [Diversispora epigaea]|uniref:Uncharacterized protein n=1 Tax=Diversispora epigaea TaxID=1348612 RepID=A0A397GAY3_9GLOM|nr:hypothetical protein Glove_575g41 [Diversispora epigaea]